MSKRKGSKQGGKAVGNRRQREGHSHASRPAGHTSEAAVEEMFQRFARYMQTAGSAEEACAAARADMRAAAEEIVRLAGGRNLIKVVSSVRVAMIMDRAVTGIDVSAAVLELVALILTCVDQAAEEAEGSAETVFMPPRITAAGQAALSAGSLISLFDSPSRDADSAVRFFSVQREIALRNPVYPHMLLDTLRGLFTDPAVEADCITTLGFTGLQAVNIMEAVRSLSVAALSERFARMEAARDASLPFIQSWRTGRKQASPLPDEDHRAAAQELFDAIQDLTTHVEQAAVIDVDAVAESTGYRRSTVEAVLDAYTLTGITNLDEALDRFFQGDNPLRIAPIVVDPDGRKMLVHDALALPAVREVIETRLQAAGRWDAYKAHRGAWVENAAVDLLVGALPGAQVFRGFNYFVPDPAAVIPQIGPETFTKRVEGDALILIDDIALIIEVKSVALTPDARGGVARQLRGKLRAIITDAADQAGRLRERITTDKRIRLDDGLWIDTSGIQEIHTIAVGLEDLSGVTTATTTLLAAGVLKPDNIPWTVSIHDLRIVCELLDRTSDLLLYLRRRTEPMATWKYRAVDELDLFLLFLRRGLYVEPDPNKTAQVAPWVGTPSAGDQRRYETQIPELVNSHTAPLDAWYDSQLDPAAPPANKPRLNVNPRLLKLIDQVTATAEPGSLSTATSLLEGDAKIQRADARVAGDLAKSVRRDRRRHSLTRAMVDTTGRCVLLVWVCHGPDEDVNAVVADLLRYLQAKKHQTGAYRASCMLFDPTGTRLLRLLYENQTQEPNPLLEQAIGELVPLNQMRRDGVPTKRARRA